MQKGPWAVRCWRAAGVAHVRGCCSPSATRQNDTYTLDKACIHWMRGGIALCNVEHSMQLLCRKQHQRCRRQCPLTSCSPVLPALNLTSEQADTTARLVARSNAKVSVTDRQPAILSKAGLLEALARRHKVAEGFCIVKSHSNLDPLRLHHRLRAAVRCHVACVHASPYPRAHAHCQFPPHSLTCLC